jgi:Family of unknown function (DUF6518)
VTGRLARTVIVAGGVGLLLGLLSIAGDTPSPYPWWRVFTVLGNIAAPWTIAAFLVGRNAKAPGPGAIAGGVAMVVGIVVYFLYYFSGAISVASTANIGIAASIWLGVALISGPVLGLCGGRVSMGNGELPLWAVVLPSAVLLAEAVWVAVTWRIWAVPNPHDVVELVVVVLMVSAALALPFLTLRGTSRLAVAYMAMLALGAAGFGALAGLHWLLLQR